MEQALLSLLFLQMDLRWFLCLWNFFSWQGVFICNTCKKKKCS